VLFLCLRYRCDQLTMWGERMFDRLSIRMVLGQIIGFLGIFLLMQCATGLYGAVEHNSEARRVALLASTSEQLFSTLIGFRLERGTAIASLAAEAPADRSASERIASNREISEKGYRNAMRLLAGINDAGLAPIVERFTAAHEALAPQRSKADAAILQPKSARDSVKDDYPKVAQAYLDAILAISDALEASLQMVDPVLDHLLRVKQSAWSTRNYGGLVAIRIEQAAAGNRPWTPAEINGAAEDTGRAALAWSQINNAAARADAPAAIVAVVNRSKQPEAQTLINRQLEVIKTLSSGKATDIPVIELQKLNTAALSYSVDLVHAALAEMVARAEHQTSSTLNVIVDAGMMLVALMVTGAGLTIVRRRVSTPIRAPHRGDAAAGRPRPHRDARWNSTQRRNRRHVACGGGVQGEHDQGRPARRRTTDRAGPQGTPPGRGRAVHLRIRRFRDRIAAHAVLSLDRTAGNRADDVEHRRADQPKVGRRRLGLR